MCGTRCQGLGAATGRHLRLVGFVLTMVGATVAGATVPAPAGPTPVRRAPSAWIVDGSTPEGHSPPGLARLERTATTPMVTGIATFGGRGPGRAGVARLEHHGLLVGAYRKLPLAVVHGTLAQLQEAVRLGAAADIYPDERLAYDSLASPSAETGTSLSRFHVTVETSGDAYGTNGVGSPEVTGAGVGVAVIDTGIDAGNPDLTQRVAHNFKVVGPEYASLPDDAGPGSRAVAFDTEPLRNSDLTSGHGTHVAGIIAAAGTGPDRIRGVAPGAHLVGYAAGEGPTVLSVLAAYDHLLEHHEEWDVRVVNNSWGVTHQHFDPDEPVNRATRAAHDVGMVVVFSAGNNHDEMTINRFSVAPWVISVASVDAGRIRSQFSSLGIEFDNSEPVAVPAGGHVRFQGDRVGLRHPDLSAPGEKIHSTGSRTGLVEAAKSAAAGFPAPPGSPQTISGTSQAAPHVAGAAALVLEARPDLTPDHVRAVLVVTAAAVADRPGDTADDTQLWRIGYGFVDAAAAVALVRSPGFDPAGLAAKMAEIDERAVAARRFPVLASDLWNIPAPAVSVHTRGLGQPAETFAVEVTPETVALKASFAFEVPIPGRHPYKYDLALRDAAGRAIEGEILRSERSGSVVFFADLRTEPSGATPSAAGFTFGTWTLTITGNVGASDGPALRALNDDHGGGSVSVFLSQLGAPDRRN